MEADQRADDRTAGGQDAGDQDADLASMAVSSVANEATGSAAICALVEAGRLRAAAAAAAHVRESGTAANASPLLSLLAFASGPPVFLSLPAS